MLMSKNERRSCHLFGKQKLYIMKNLKYSVGIDISKNDFKACFSVIDDGQKVTVKSSATFVNSLKGFSEFSIWYNKHHKDDLPLFFLLEATGVYYEHLAWFLYKKDEKVSVILANKAKRYLQSLGMKSKNDKIDAKGLAQMCSEKCLPLWNPISKSIYELRSLTRLHEDLQNQRTMVNNQLHAISHSMYSLKQAQRSLQKLYITLENELVNIEKDILNLIEKDEKLKLKYANIKTIKGVGLMTFAVLVAETNGFELVNNKSQLVSYAGYDVVENQSGLRFGKTRISKKGNAHIRRILHMPSFCVVRYEPSFKSFFDRIHERTHFKMKAYVAVQKKLLTLIYSLWKKDQSYVQDYIGNYSTAQAIGPISVDSEGIQKKPDSKELASQDEHSIARAMSPLSICQI
jgi:transposase